MEVEALGEVRLRASAMCLVLAHGTSASADPAPPEDDPDPGSLAGAPPADRASGIAVSRAQPDHRVANTLLSVPRAIVTLVLTGPRYAAAEVDSYLESRSPNAFGRDIESRWQFGAIVDWETVLGPSLGLRVGYRLADHTTVDAYGGLFGARGQSGGFRAALGRFTVFGLDAGRELARVFAGVGDGGPRADYDERMIAAAATGSVRGGRFELVAKARADYVAAGDGGDRPLSTIYDGSMLAGFDESQRAGTAELAVSYDGRQRAHKWIPAGAPSTGFYIRGAAAYTRGDATRTGMFSTGRATLEARRLFDLFHGDRVLSIGVRAEAITAAASDVPFDRLPSLGGHDRMRAFARDELRDRSTTFADLEYEWALGGSSRGYLFVEAGGAQPGLTDLASSRFHVGYGGGVRVLDGVATTLRIQVAGSDEGRVGFLLQLGAL